MFGSWGILLSVSHFLLAESVFKGVDLVRDRTWARLGRALADALGD